MTLRDADDYVRLIKVLDLATRSVQPAYWPLCLPAVTVMRHVEQSRYVCPMCHVTGSHRCSCPVSGVRKGLRARGARGGDLCR
jgi:hypothetical protein